MNKILLIAKKELQSYFFNPLGYLSAGTVILIATWLFLNNLFKINQADMSPYWSIVGYILSLFVPAMTMSIFADEKKNNTWEVLKTLPIKEEEIVWGKFWGGAGFLLFTILLSLPIVISLFLLGKPQMGLILGGYFGVILLTFSYLTLGILISALTDQALVAFLITSVILILNTLMGQVKYLSDFSLNTRSATFGFGLINIFDLFFFISWIIIFNTITTLVLKSKRK
jgi:ABC-2 type transport system permease protein